MASEGLNVAVRNGARRPYMAIIGTLASISEFQLTVFHGTLRTDGDRQCHCACGALWAANGIGSGCTERAPIPEQTFENGQLKLSNVAVSNGKVDSDGQVAIYKAGRAPIQHALPAHRIVIEAYQVSNLGTKPPEAAAELEGKAIVVVLNQA